jgi:putative transposase
MSAAHPQANPPFQPGANPFDHGKIRTHYLPRLDPEYYRGDAVVFWTSPVAHSGTGWLSPEFHARFRELTLHAAERESLLCPVYCLMPDHLHMVWMGLEQRSDQRVGMAFLRTYLEKALAPHKFQHQPHDHVLREEERQRNSFARVCFYILNNPLAAGLVEAAADWPYYGAVVPGYPEMDPLRQPDFWKIFWKVYSEKRHRDASHRRAPPRGGCQNNERSK